MPPATRQRATAQPFTSPAIDFTPLSSFDVESMLTAAEQSSESTATLRRSTRRATLLAKAANLTQQGKAVVESSAATQQSAVRSAAVLARRSTVVALVLPPKSSTSNPPRVTAINAAIATSTQRSKLLLDKENVGPVQSAGASKQPVTVSAVIKPTTAEVRRSSRLSSVPTTAATVAPVALTRTRHTRKPTQTGVERVNIAPNVATRTATLTDECTTQSQLVSVSTAVEPIIVMSPVKAVPVLTPCNSTAPPPSASLIPPPPPSTTSSSPTANAATLPHTTTVGSSLPTARNLHLRPIDAVQVLSPVAAPLSARARTHGRTVLTHRRRSASVRRESLLGHRATLVWQAKTPPTDEVKAIVKREEEKRRLKAEKEKEKQRQDEEAEKERQRMAPQQETAVVETRRRLRLSHSPHPFNQAAAQPNTPSQLSSPHPEQHSIELQEAIEMTEANDWEVCEERTSTCTVRSFISVSVCAGLLAAIGAVMFYPSQVDAWLS